jgi:hypothetical protein
VCDDKYTDAEHDRWWVYEWQSCLLCCDKREELCKQYGKNYPRSS